MQVADKQSNHNDIVWLHVRVDLPGLLVNQDIRVFSATNVDFRYIDSTSLTYIEPGSFNSLSSLINL